MCVITKSALVLPLAQDVQLFLCSLSTSLVVYYAGQPLEKHVRISLFYLLDENYCHLETQNLNKLRKIPHLSMLSNRKKFGFFS